MNLCEKNFRYFYSRFNCKKLKIFLIKIVNINKYN